MSGSTAAPDPGMMGGSAPSDAGDDSGASDADDNVLVTITSDGQGGYVIYSGDEPEGGDEGDQSDEDTEAMGAAGNAPAPNGGAPPAQGQPATSIGEALKITMTILQSDASSQGAPGSSQDQFEAGFGASKSPTPASGAVQKY